MTEEMIFRLVAEMPLIAFLLYELSRERKERIQAQERLFEVLEGKPGEGVNSA